MSSNEAEPNTQKQDTPRFPRLKSDATTNNYAEWTRKAQTALDDMGVWEVVVEEPPIQPKLVEAKEIDVYVEGKLVRAKTKGNEEAVEKWKSDNAEWIRKNKTALRWITNSVDGATILVIKGCVTAKDCWDNLHSEFNPVNLTMANNLRRQILTNACKRGTNVMQWILDMRKLYDRLCDIDPTAIIDEDFGRTLFAMLPPTPTWRNFCSGKRDMFNKTGIRSKEVIEAIKMEWTAQKSLDEGEEDDVEEATASRAFTNYKKRPSDPHPSEQRQKRFKSAQNSTKPNNRGGCTNCKRSNHTYEDCYWKGGGKEGQFPWSQNAPKANQAEKLSLADRMNDNEMEVDKSESYTAHQAILNDHYVWTLNAPCETEISAEVMELASPEHMASCKIPLLNMSIAKTNHFFHDSGANRHIAHDRSIFSEYLSVQPISVSAFGDK